MRWEIHVARTGRKEKYKGPHVGRKMSVKENTWDIQTKTGDTVKISIEETGHENA
jgi:hypothetical protein